MSSEPASTSAVPAAARHRATLAYAIAVVVILADQLIKQWILYGLNLPAIETMHVFGPFHLSMVWNRGVSFGLFGGEAEWVRWALSGFSLAVAIALAIWARKVDRLMMGVALGLVIGGAIGNMIDRVRFGAVADFLDFRELYFPWVFNVADSGITIGVVLLLIDSLRHDSKR